MRENRAGLGDFRAASLLVETSRPPLDSSKLSDVVPQTAFPTGHTKNMLAKSPRQEEAFKMNPAVKQLSALRFFGVNCRLKTSDWTI